MLPSLTSTGTRSSRASDWFHFTGITPALGPNVVEICLAACKAAKAHGAKISCDLNYRGKLWTRAAGS